MNVQFYVDGELQYQNLWVKFIPRVGDVVVFGGVCDIDQLTVVKVVYDIQVIERDTVVSEVVHVYTTAGTGR